jgi:hypothetical protein
MEFSIEQAVRFRIKKIGEDKQVSSASFFGFDYAEGKQVDVYRGV